MSHIRRLPARPLLELFPPGPEAEDVRNGDVTGSDGWIAQRCGVSERTVTRWRLGHATLTVVMADRVACELGRHPGEIWGDLWWNLPDTQREPAI